MLELNTDRMWYAVGALLLGALLLAGVIRGFPNVMSNWSVGMADSVTHSDLKEGQELVVNNGDFELFSEGWSYSDGDVIFDGSTAHIPAGATLSTPITIPNNGLIQVKIKAEGHGNVNVYLDGAKDSTRMESINLFESTYTYRVDLTKTKADKNKLMFTVASNSEMIIESVEVLYLGVAE